ncbi:unnamed protein product [Adineta steineri]|uniref:Protein regulator of cytokinesis 1 n=1 Tax=Adineta steineri TaxID=433720 RepID=A0A814ZHZ9_9BILA|nr:unnamed protein product [Adineta steineri]CAF1529871.1 unnamed protein product [Adineta steineri]
MTETLPIDSLMIDRWTNQWLKQLGFNNEQLIKRNNKVEQFSRFVLDRIQTKKLTDITKREQLLVETLREYEHRLSRTGFENDINEEFENMKLKQKEILIERKHQELDIKEEKCIKELDQLSQNERSLCQILTATPMEITPDETLVKRIENLRDYLTTLETIKIERLTTIKSYGTRLDTLCTQLDFKLDKFSIACQLMDEKYESCLTTDSLNQIESLLNELECKSKEQEKYVYRLVETLEKLYTKLARDDATPPKRSAAYILRHNNAETVKQLENEISELQAKRMATSQVYCESMRKKIEEFYEQYQIGLSERHSIDFETITPETLDECDREYDRLDDMCRARKPIIDVFEQWKLLVQQHTEFLKKSSSAARFHERGYSAVKEQAERKRFAIALPKAERTCLNTLEQWEKEHMNEQFLINDIPIRQILEQQHNATSNTTTTTVSKTVSSVNSTAVPQRTLSKNNIRKKSLRNIVKQTIQEQVTENDHDEDDTLEFTQLENIKNINGVARIVTSTPKIGKNHSSNHTVVDMGRNKTNDLIHKRRLSKRVIPTRR